MSKKIDQTDLDTIIRSLPHFPNGASLEDIVSFLSKTQSKRTLQYRLAFLTKLGQVSTTGQSRSRRYHLVTKTDTIQLVPCNTKSIPLSAEAKSIQRPFKREVQQGK